MDSITENQTCPTVGYQAASVCVPVTVTPYANAGATMTERYGVVFEFTTREDCSKRIVEILSRA